MVQSTDKKKSNERKIHLVYIILFAIFVFKMFFYINQNYSTPDTIAQISYAIYMEQHPEVLSPDFSDISMYSFGKATYENDQIIYQMKKANSTCYLGHPPLYYKMLAVFDNVYEDADGNIFVNYTKIRLVNTMLTAFTMILALLAGYKVLTKDREWYLHLLYAAVVTSLPLYGYVGSSVNNDNLCSLGVVVVWLGLISYLETGYSYKTYWLMALGLAFCVFGKLTTGFIVLIATIVIILVDIVKTKKLSIMLNKGFVTTLPVYGAVLVYFLGLYAEYGNFQPAYVNFAPMEEVVNSHLYVEYGTGEMVTFAEDVEHFFGEVWRTWSATYNSAMFVTRDGILSIGYAIVLLLFVGAAVREAIMYIKNKGEYNDVIVVSFCIGLLAMLAQHFLNHYNRHSQGGYAGGAQGRYYMTSIPLIAMGATQMVAYIQERIRGFGKNIGKYLTILLAMWTVYLDFFYFAINVNAVI